MNKTEASSVLQLLKNIKALTEVDKILSTFIPAFLSKNSKRDGHTYLHGNFNLGGTKSSRLSSSKPNLQQIPSTGTEYAKPIKECFEAPEDWLMVGSDYSSLEDRISALQTKDPNKLKVYIDGYDGHCLRAHAYYEDQMPDIIDTVESINSIEIKYPKFRQSSKTPTFALTYKGTHKTLMKNCGFSEEEAKNIEARYHKLYAVSDQWVEERIKEASKRGYVELAFGVRLRTPILEQVIYGSGSMPYEAHKEAKTAGNALTQSYGLLNSRAANEFMEKVWASKWKEQVLPIAQIHDAQYYLIRNNLDCLKWVNDNLIECMTWNDLPEIQHDIVKLEAQLCLYYPTWANEIKLPNDITQDELRRIINENTK